MFLALDTSLAQPRCGVLISLDDVDIAGASAQIARNRMTNLVFGRSSITIEERITGHKHTGCAIAALQSMLLKKSLLQRMQLAVTLKALDGQYLASIDLRCKHGAGLHRATIDDDRAGPAVARVASYVRACESKRFAEEMNEEQSRLDFRSMLDSVDPYVDLDFCHRLSSSLRAINRLFEGARRQHPNEVAFIVSRSSYVIHGLRLGCGDLGRLFDRGCV